jgi:hypothetical protein
MGKRRLGVPSGSHNPVRCVQGASFVSLQENGRTRLRKNGQSGV